MIPRFGGGFGKWVWQKVWAGLGGWSWRPYVVIPGFGGGLGGGSGRKSGRRYVAIPGFGGGSLAAVGLRLSWGRLRSSEIAAYLRGVAVPKPPAGLGFPPYGRRLACPWRRLCGV